MKMIVAVMLTLLLTATALPAQSAPTPSQTAAARELLEVTRTRENFVSAMALGMEQGGEDLSESTRAALRGWMEENFRYDDMEPEFIRLFIDLYTESEMREMAALFRTPAGQRYVELSPELAVRSERIVQARLATKMPDLLRFIGAVMEEEEAAVGAERK